METRPVTPEALTTQIPPDVLERLKAELDKSQNSLIDRLDYQIIDICFTEGEEPETIKLMNKHSDRLKKQLYKLYNYLETHKDAAIAAQIKEIDTAMKTIIDMRRHNPTETPEAKRLLSQLEDSVDDKIDALENDPVVHKKIAALRTAINKADNEIDECRETAARKKAARAAGKQGFWASHPIFKKVCIGALIGLGVVAVAAAITGAIILSGGAAAAPIVAFASFMLAKVGLAGVIGIGVGAAVSVIGLGAATGAIAGQVQAKRQAKVAAQTASSTAKVFEQMRPTDPLLISDAELEQQDAVAKLHAIKEPVAKNAVSHEEAITPVQPMTLGRRK